MKFSVKKAYQLWKEMWEMLASSGDTNKGPTIAKLREKYGWDINSIYLNEHCPACTVAEKYTTRFKQLNECNFCPVKWTKNQKTNTPPCAHFTTNFCQWSGAETIEGRKRTANMIAKRKWYYHNSHNVVK